MESIRVTVNETPRAGIVHSMGLWVKEIVRGGFVMGVGGDIPLTGERSGLWNVYRLGMVCLKKMFVVPCN